MQTYSNLNHTNEFGKYINVFSLKKIGQVLVVWHQNIVNNSLTRTYFISVLHMASQFWIEKNWKQQQQKKDKVHLDNRLQSRRSLITLCYLLKFKAWRKLRTQQNLPTFCILLIQQRWQKDKGVFLRNEEYFLFHDRWKKFLVLYRPSLYK